MITRATNFSITERAALALDREKARVRVGADEVFALIYLVSVTNPDGTPEPGFQPGYMATAFPLGAEDGWTLAHLPSGAEFYFMQTRFRWEAEASYVVDLTGSLFSIEPAH